MMRKNSQNNISRQQLMYRFFNFLVLKSEMKMICGLFFISLLIFISLPNLRAQETEEDDKPINVDTLLFTIPLTVTDRKGRSIAGLKQENFEVFQDGEEQEIEFFLNDDAPMNVAILLDTSQSTKKVLDNIQKAAREFIKVLRPEDKAVIVTFDNRTSFLSNLVSDRKILSKAIDQAKIGGGGGSDMYAAVDDVLERNFTTLKGRKAVIVLTDGMVIPQKITAQQTLDEMQEADVFFYPIIFKTDFYQTKNASNKKSSLVNILQIFADETGGRLYEKDATKLKEAFVSISEEMKKQYLIGFYPQNTERGKTSGYFRVDVNRGDLIVRSKKKLKL